MNRSLSGCDNQQRSLREHSLRPYRLIARFRALPIFPTERFI